MEFVCVLKVVSMRKRSVRFAVVCLALLPMATVFGAEMQWLSYRTAAQANRVVGDMLMDRIEVSAEAPDGVDIPKFEGKQQYFGTWKSPMVENGFRRLAFDGKRSKGPFGIMYFDSNGDGKLSDEKAIKANLLEGNTAYLGPVPVYFEGEDGPITYHLNFRVYIRSSNSSVQVHVTSGGWYEGYIKVGGEKKFCQLIDYNANAVFNEKESESLGYDSDRIRIGKEGTRDSCFVGNYIQLDDKLYNLEIAGDGAFIKIWEATDAAYGTIAVPESITEFSASSANGLMKAKLEGGKAKLPVGKYRVYQWVAERKDKSGDVWKVVGSKFRKSNGLFEVMQGTETTLDIGGPVIASLKADRHKQKYTFNQKLKGRLGENINLTQNNRPPRAAKLHIKSKDGSYDRSFSFEYG